MLSQPVLTKNQRQMRGRDEMELNFFTMFNRKENENLPYTSLASKGESNSLRDARLGSEFSHPGNSHLLQNPLKQEKTKIVYSNMGCMEL